MYRLVVAAGEHRVRVRVPGQQRAPRHHAPHRPLLHDPHVRHAPQPRRRARRARRCAGLYQAVAFVVTQACDVASAVRTCSCPALAASMLRSVQRALECALHCNCVIINDSHLGPPFEQEDGVMPCMHVFRMCQKKHVHALQARARRRRQRTWRRRWRSSASCSTAATASTTLPWPSSSRGWPPLAPGALLLEQSYEMILIGLLERYILPSLVKDLMVFLLRSGYLKP